MYGIRGVLAADPATAAWSSHLGNYPDDGSPGGHGKDTDDPPTPYTKNI